MAKKYFSEFEQTLRQNRYSYQMYFDKLMSIAISEFSWENIPDTVDERYIELALFMESAAVWFNDDELDGNVCLSVIQNGNFGVYGEPYIRRAYSRYNHYQKLLKMSDSVIIWNDLSRKPSVQYIEYYARRLWFYDIIIDVNVNAQRTPVLITCTDKQKLTMENLYKEFVGGYPVIFGDKNTLKPTDIGVLKTDAPFNADKIYILRQNIWNDALTYLGITNVDTTKRERMVTNEVERNQGGVAASRLSRLKARRQAVKKINRMFGINVSVNYDSEIDMIARSMVQSDMDETATRLEEN